MGSLASGTGLVGHPPRSVQPIVLSLTIYILDTFDSAPGPFAGEYKGRGVGWVVGKTHPTPFGSLRTLDCGCSAAALTEIVHVPRSFFSLHRVWTSEVHFGQLTA
jgi:hypothetical protein